MALYGRRKKFNPYFETTSVEHGGYEFDEDLDDLEEGELPAGEPYYVGGSAKFSDAVVMLSLLRKAGLVHGARALGEWRRSDPREPTRARRQSHLRRTHSRVHQCRVRTHVGSSGLD